MEFKALESEVQANANLIQSKFERKSEFSGWPASVKAQATAQAASLSGGQYQF